MAGIPWGLDQQKSLPRGICQHTLKKGRDLSALVGWWKDWFGESEETCYLCYNRYIQALAVNLAINHYLSEVVI